MINIKQYVEAGKLVTTVHTAANANDDWREVGNLVRSPFWGERYPDRLEFKPNGKCLAASDLIAIADFMKNYVAPKNSC